MKNVLLFVASGNPGKEVARELVRQHYRLTAVVRNDLLKKNWKMPD